MKKKHIFTSECGKWQEDFYDLRDDAVRQQLIDMGFTAKSKVALP